MRRIVACSLTAVVLAFVAAAAEYTQSPTPGGAPPDAAAEARKLLTDPQPKVRLRAALVLVSQADEQVMNVLIDLLADLLGDERRQAEGALRQLAGEWSPNPKLPGDDELSRKIRREAWASWWKALDGPALLAAFRQRILTKEDAAAAQVLIDKLGDPSADTRDRAAAALIAQGPKVAGLLKEAAKSANAEQAKSAATCLKTIAQKDAHNKLPLSAARLLAIRKPAGAAEALLAYVTFSDDSRVKDEIGKALKTLAAGGADAALIAALGDPLPLRRILAAEALAGANGGKHLPALRKLLKDADVEVRLRAAVALVQALDKESVPALIAVLAEVPRAKAWQAEDLLRRLAGDRAPAVPWGKDDDAARKKLTAAWQAWWKEHGAAIDMAQLGKIPSGSGLTLVAETGSRGGFKGKGKGGIGVGPAVMSDRVVALDPEGKVQWQINNVDYPIDVQLLPGERVLIAEYDSNRITERDFKGAILWEYRLPAFPGNVQRLDNGNTFVALCGPAAVSGGNGKQLLEVDPTGKLVAGFTVVAPPAGGGFGAVDFVVAAHKMPDGKMICLMSDEIGLWLDGTGKELKRFPLPRARPAAVMNAYGAIDVTPEGHLIFAQSDGLITEYDADGKLIWQVKAQGYRASKLPNGNVVVTTLSGGAVELDGGGRIIWQYDPPAGLQVVRARRQ
jgi:HEAT repeat protein